MDKGEAISKVKAYRLLLNDYFQIDKVYLFGSYAKNSQREDSDIDVAIIVNSLDGDYFSINPLLWKLRRQIDDRIEPILIEKDFDDAGFIGEIQKHGIEIA
ncbi:MAG: nucleotidyltransferase domain-containing protein [Cyclobacteriaceae bacterium]|nr:nucleotidyltransferase domain-containing protein [Cyclobacteriaceae bacterium]